MERTVWPAAAFPLDATRIGTTYQALRESLAREVVLGNAEQLDRALGPIPADLTTPGAVGAWVSPVAGPYTSSSDSWPAGQPVLPVNVSRRKRVVASTGRTGGPLS